MSNNHTRKTKLLSSTTPEYQKSSVTLSKALLLNPFYMKTFRKLRCLCKFPSQNVGIEMLKNPKAFIDYSQTIMLKIWKTITNKEKESVNSV